MGSLNYLGSIENIHRIPYDSFIRRESASRGITPSEMELLVETETIARRIPREGFGASYDAQCDNPLRMLSREYYAVTDFDLRPGSGLFAAITGDNVLIVQGTGIKLKPKI